MMDISYQICKKVCTVQVINWGMVTSVYPRIAQGWHVDLSQELRCLSSKPAINTDTRGP